MTPRLPRVGRSQLSDDEQAAATRALTHARKHGLPQEHHERLQAAVDEHKVHELDGPHKDLLGQVLEDHMDSDHIHKKHRKHARALIEKHDLSYPSVWVQNPMAEQQQQQAQVDQATSVGV